MGKLTKEIFNESCCDGGACNLNDFSAQSCGCDARANYTCVYHVTYKKGYEEGYEAGWKAAEANYGPAGD